MMAASLPLPIEESSRVERVRQGALAAALATLGFFVPFSTAGTSFALAALFLLALATGGRLWRTQAWREPVFAMGLLLLAYIGLRTVAENGWQRESLTIVNHYHELLMIPLLWALMRTSRHRNAFLLGLMAGALALALAHWVPLSPLWAFKVGQRRISAGFGLALCAFVFFEEARAARLPRLAGYGAAAFLALTVVFAVAARTGYIALALLMVCAAWRAAPRKWRPAAIALLLVVAVGLVTLLSSVREKRGDTAISNQIRTELFYNGVQVVREHWLVGTGWGGYAKAYADVAARNGAPPGAFWAHTENAHNEYLMQAGAGGLPALLLFAAWLALPIVRLLRRRSAPGGTDATLACIALTFAVACLFNSLLLDFIEAHLYGALVAWLMASRETA